MKRLVLTLLAFGAGRLPDGKARRVLPGRRSDAQPPPVEAGPDGGRGAETRSTLARRQLPYTVLGRHYWRTRVTIRARRRFLVWQNFTAGARPTANYDMHAMTAAHKPCCCRAMCACAISTRTHRVVRQRPRLFLHNRLIDLSLRGRQQPSASPALAPAWWKSRRSCRASQPCRQHPHRRRARSPEAPPPVETKPEPRPGQA